MKIAILFLLTAAAAAGGAPTLINLSAPVTWTELNEDALKGRPAELAWSDDDSTLYLEVVDGTTAGALAYRHYLIKKGAAPATVPAPPAWAEAYWKWKSAKTFFGDPLMTIDLDTSREVLDNPRDRNTAYLNSERKAPATLDSKTVGAVRVVNRLVFKRHIIGEFVDEGVFPGYTFSWSPESLRLIAFRSPSGRLTIMNAEAETEIAGDGKDVWLPAWSESGEQIAYLERTGRKRFTVRVMTAL